jgi:hypothetical protein
MDLKTIIAREFSAAKTYYTNNFASNEEEALDYFNGEKPGEIDTDIKEVFTKIVSPDVANAVEHTLADIMPAFSSEAPAIFVPTSKDDEIRAQIETTFVNDVFLQQSNGFIKLTTAVKDAFIRKIGVVEIQTYEKTVVQYQKLEKTNAEVLSTLLRESQNQNDTVEVAEINGKTEYDPTVLDSTFSATIKRSQKQRQLYIDVFPPDELLFSDDAEEPNLDNCRFVARERLLRVSELIELGYDRTTVEKLPPYSQTTSIGSKPHNRDIQVDRDNETHISNREVRVAFCYMLIDTDDDGIAERRKIVIAGDLESSPKILSNEPCSMQPFAVGVPFVYPHRVRGISLFDKIKQIQLIKTKVLRQLLTAGEQAARGRLGVVNNMANVVDLEASIFGGYVRLTSPNGVVNLPNPPFPSDVAQLLNIMDKERKESGGSAIDKADETMLIGGDTAHGLERIMSAMEQLNSLIAKTIAETLVRQIYVKIHSNLRQHFLGEMNLQQGGNWITATPSTWPVRNNVKISLGLTMGDRMRMAQNYTMLLNEQKEMLEKGSILTTEQNMYALLIARANALMIPNAHGYYTDPRSPEGQQAVQARTVQQQQQQQLLMQEKLMNLELLPKVEAIKAQGAATVQQLKNDVELQKMQSEMNKAIAELSVKYSELGLKLTELNAKYDGEEVPDTVQ